MPERASVKTFKHILLEIYLNSYLMSAEQLKKSLFLCFPFFYSFLLGFTYCAADINSTVIKIDC